MLFGLIKTKDERKELTFLRAFIRGQYKVFLDKKLISHMLDKGFGIDIQGYYGNTLLHWALMTNNEDMVQFLLKRGANPSIRNRTRITAFYIAAQKGNVAAMDMMLQTKETKKEVMSNSYNWTSLHMAVRECWKETTKFLLKKGADINAKNAVGKTPLHIASAKWNTELLKEILKSKPDLNIQDSNGNTPLHDAVLSNTTSPQNVKMLLAHGASPMIRNYEGLTPLQLAFRRQKMQESQMLSNAESEYLNKDLPVTPQYVPPHYIARQYIECRSA
ncbi:MAG: ankyrin repeat domain-containing protein [Alphaproteobacteria bacterium]|nr:ankyrin repeat domain-containing protein [Alphaproteobacteria bacterium]